MLGFPNVSSDYTLDLVHVYLWESSLEKISVGTDEYTIFYVLIQTTTSQLTYRRR